MKKVLIVLGFLAFASTHVAAMSLSDMRTQIRRNVRDTSSDTTLQTFSNAYLLSYINQAQRDINSYVWAVKATTSTTLSANTTYYDMPDAFLAAEQVVWTKTTTGITSELEEISERSLRQRNPDYERQTAGPPVEYFIRYPKDGSDNLELGVYPAPNSTSTGTLKVDYVAEPADLSGDTDVPFDGYEHLTPYHNSIVHLVTSRLLLIKGKTVEAQAYNALFQSDLDAMASRLGMKPNYNPSMIGGGPGQ